MHGACVLRASTWKIFVAKVASFKFIEYFGRDLHFASRKVWQISQLASNSVSILSFSFSFSFGRTRRWIRCGAYWHSCCSLKWKVIESSKMRWLIQTFKLPSFCLRFQCLTPKGHCLHRSFLLGEHEIARSFQSHRNLFVYSSLCAQRASSTSVSLCLFRHAQTCLCFSCVCVVCVSSVDCSISADRLFIGLSVCHHASMCLLN